MLRPSRGPQGRGYRRRVQNRLSRGGTAAIFRALCRNRFPAAKPENPSPNGSRLPGRGKSCASTPPGGISCRRRAPSASVTWPNRPKSIRPTRIGSNRTCRSVRRDPGRATPCGAAIANGLARSIPRGPTDSRPTNTAGVYSLSAWGRNSTGLVLVVVVRVVCRTVVVVVDCS